ncbi:MAG: YegS/Rv2252/BmrU family lipid kinase [Gemmatimonas sp.]|nr:YegS/Rv2252/BmrU family lipid kinase [Gemmatimonas sp.]
MPPAPGAEPVDRNGAERVHRVRRGVVRGQGVGEELRIRSRCREAARSSLGRSARRSIERARDDGAGHSRWEGLRSYFVIFNPLASRGRAAKSRATIEASFAAGGADYRLVPTEYRGHAVELAQDAVRDGWSAIVAVGGDGIVHEVVNGLMCAAGNGVTVPVGIVPVGSGNDFVKMLGVPPHRPGEAVRRILTAEPRPVDVGKVVRHCTGGGPDGAWYFTNGVGVGFDAQVATHARAIKRLRGAAIYAWALLKALRELRSPRIDVFVDGVQISDRALILTTVSNGPCHGGNFWLCPGAEVDDGALDILIATGRSLPRVLRLLPRVMVGKHLGQWGVELHRGRSVVVRSTERLPIHADGEFVADWVTELEIEIVPGRLTVLA